MRILTTSLVEYPPLLSILKKTNSNPFCGWAFAASEALLKTSDDMTIGVISIASGISKVEKYVDGKYVFYRMPSKGLHRIEKKEVLQASEVLMDFKPDIIHLNGTEFSLGLEILSANTQHIPVVASIQGLAFVCYRYNQGYIPSSVFLRHYSFRDLLKWDNQFQRNEIMRKRGVLEIETLNRVEHVIGRTDWDRIHAVTVNPNIKYHFCNETLRGNFYTAEKWSYEKCRKHTIFCSNGSVPLKGAHFLLQALTVVKRKYPNVMLRIAGPNVLSSQWPVCLKLTSYQKYLKSLIRKSGIENNVEFLGFLSQEEMVREYQACNVYVLPSCIENSPNSLCEAQLLGVPCVSSICGGTPNFVEDEVDGLLYRCEEWEMLADKIMRLFEQPNLAIRMGEEAMIKASERHDIMNNAEELLQIYKNILENEPYIEKR